MKKITAFFTALALVFAVALCVHLFTSAAAKEPQDGIYAWTDETKYTSMHALAASVDEDTLLIMGSSELQHQKSTPYNPGNLFQGTGIRPLLIGAGYYQSLFHATALTALEEEMENRKAVLILAPRDQLPFPRDGGLPFFRGELHRYALQRKAFSGNQRIYHKTDPQAA